MLGMRLYLLFSTLIFVVACSKSPRDLARKEPQESETLLRPHCADEPLVRATGLSVGFQDLSTNRKEYTLLVQRRGALPSDNELGSLKDSISLRTWPELAVIPSSVRTEDISVWDSPFVKKVVVTPASALEGRWYALYVSSLPTPFVWSEEVLVKSGGDGSFLFRFRPDSAPAARRMVVYDKFEPLSDPVEKKFETAIDIEFTEGIQFTSPSAVRSMLNISAPDLRGCDIYQVGRPTDPTEVIRARCKGRLRGGLSLTLATAGLQTTSATSVVGAVPGVVAIQGAAGSGGAAPGFAPTQGAIAIQGAADKQLNATYDGLAPCGEGCRSQTLE